jgi:hypothetical protein
MNYEPGVPTMNYEPGVPPAGHTMDERFFVSFKQFATKQNQVHRQQDATFIRMLEQVLKP